MSNSDVETPSNPPKQTLREKADCLQCRIVGATALTGTGIYGLMLSRAGKPGSPLERRIMGAVSVGNPIQTVKEGS